MFTAAGSSLIFTVWRARRSPKCIRLTTFSYMSEVPKQQLQSQISSPLIYWKLLWECTQSTLHTNASCSRILWTVRLKHNVTFNMIGIPCDTLRRLGCMLLCKRSWVGIGSISVGAEAPSSDFQTVLYVCLRLVRYSTARSEVVTWPPFEFQMFLESRGVPLPSIFLQPKGPRVASRYPHRCPWSWPGILSRSNPLLLIPRYVRYSYSGGSVSNRYHRCSYHSCIFL